MTGIMIKEACKALTTMQGSLERLAAQFDNSEFPRYTAAERKAIAARLHDVNAALEHEKTDIYRSGITEKELIRRCQDAFELYNFAKVEAWGHGASGYIVSVSRHRKQTTSTAFDGIRTAFKFLHAVEERGDLVIAMLDATIGKHRNGLEVMLPIAKYYAALDDSAAGKFAGTDTAHVKEMAIQLSKAKLFFDTVKFEADRETYRAMRTAERLGAE